MYHLILVNEWCLFVLFVVWTVPAAFWSTFSEFWGQNAAHSALSTFVEEERATIDKLFTSTFPYFLVHFSMPWSSVRCSTFTRKKTGKIPKHFLHSLSNNSFRIFQEYIPGKLQNKNKESCFDFPHAPIMRFWADYTHYIFVYVSVKRIDF